jgi:hypothetical protein
MSVSATRACSYGLTALLLLGCERTPEPLKEPVAAARPSAPAPAEPQQRAHVAAPSSLAGAPTSAPAGSSAAPTQTRGGGQAAGDTAFRFPSQARLVAVGDVHGDLQALRRALRLAGAIDAQDQWIGKKLTVVQTGDQIDRGDQDRAVLDLLEKLEASARAAGSQLYVLNGNHELMNVVLDFRYVTAHSFQEFADLAQNAPAAAALRPVPPEAKGRAAAFAPGGSYALKLASRPIIAVVGDTLFVHGGVLPQHVEYGVGRINAEVSGFLRGTRPALPRIAESEDSPVWTRAYGETELPTSTCQMLRNVLTSLGASRMVVGHTVQKQGISSACAGQVFRIDVGLSAYYGDRPAEVLEITSSGARVLKAKPSASRSGAGADSALQSAP